LGFDPDMRFYVWYPPTIDGTFTSPLMAVLDDWKMAKHASLTTQRITYQDSRQPVFMVHRPPKGKPGDEKVHTLATSLFFDFDASLTRFLKV
jgi:hypothetical protein